MPARTTKKSQSEAAWTPSASSQQSVGSMGGELSMTTPANAPDANASPARAPSNRTARPSAAASAAWKAYIDANKWAEEEGYRHPKTSPRKQMICQSKAMTYDGARLQAWELASLPHQKMRNPHSRIHPQKRYLVEDVVRLIQRKVEHLGRAAVYPPGGATTRAPRRREPDLYYEELPFEFAIPMYAIAVSSMIPPFSLCTTCCYDPPPDLYEGDGIPEYAEQYM